MPNVQAPSFAEIYERELVGPLFRPWVDLLLDGVALTRGDRVLDLACGTAIVGMSEAGKSMSEEERARTAEAVTADSAGVIARYSDAAGLAFRMGTNVATARA